MIPVLPGLSSRPMTCSNIAVTFFRTRRGGPPPGVASRAFGPVEGDDVAVLEQLCPGGLVGEDDWPDGWLSLIRHHPRRTAWSV